MKRKTILAHLLNTVLGIALTQMLAIKTQAQGTNTFSKPGNSMNYSHNGTAWVHQSNSTYTYNPDGQVSEELIQNPLTNQNTYRSLYTYDPYGTLIRKYTYSWQNGNWSLVNGYRDSLAYTQGNKIATITTTAYRNNIWENWSFYKYSYDSNNNLIAEEFADWDAPTNAWVPYHKNDYTYDAAGLITQKQQSYYQNGSWNLMRTENYNGWHIPNVLPTSYSTTIPNSLYPRRNTITLGPNGGHTDVNEYFYANGNVWRNSTRRIETRDIRGNLTNSKSQTFNLSTNAWQDVSEHQNIYTYNNLFDITEWIVRYPDSGVQTGQPPKDRYKYVYSNFQYFSTPLGTSETKKPQLALNIFPNPATDKIQIELGNKNPQGLTATISDLTGKTFLYKTFKVSETKQLNIEALPKGIYLLQLQTEAGSTVKRIVKQ